MLLQGPEDIRYDPVDIAANIANNLVCGNCGDGSGTGRCCEGPIMVTDDAPTSYWVTDEDGRIVDEIPMDRL